jgi:hypothetical protein
VRGDILLQKKKRKLLMTKQKKKEKDVLGIEGLALKRLIFLGRSVASIEKKNRNLYPLWKQLCQKSTEGGLI